MNNHRGPAPSDQSALSLLVNAADSHDPPRSQREGSAYSEAMRLRNLEEQLLLQQHQQQQQGLGGQHGLLAQLREQNLLSQLSQNQLASLLGIGNAPAPGGDMRSTLAAAQYRQQAPQLSQADLIALSRGGGGLSSLSHLLGGGGGGLPSELEGQLQRLEELERQQRLLAASSGNQFGGGRGSRDALDVSQIHSMPPQLRQHMEQQQSLAQAEHSHHDRGNADRMATAGVPENIPKDEIEKAPGSVIVPCRARGMPMDHNFKTAYFVIPENVKHGEELICSYFACRNAGIKFRYCSHCKVPVAKRNFRKRHKHGGEIAAGEDSGAEDDASAVVENNKKGIPIQITASHEEPEEADALSSQTSNSAQKKEKAAEAAYEMQRGLVRSSMRTFEEGRRNQGATNVPSPAEGGKISQERKKRWEELLSKRPSTKEGDSMSNWLMQVLSVSDLGTPLKAVDEVKETASHHTAPSAGAPEEAAPAPAPVPAPAEEKEEGEEDEDDNVGSGVVVKKKRPAELISDASDRPESFAGGSFAEWKERKMQRKMAKAPEAGEEGEM